VEEWRNEGLEDWRIGGLEDRMGRLNLKISRFGNGISNKDYHDLFCIAVAYFFLATNYSD
jgi:hypothetical protein